MEEEYINVNLTVLFAEKQAFLTQRGWIESKDLLDGDKIQAVFGESSWAEISKQKNEKKIPLNHFFG